MKKLFVSSLLLAVAIQADARIAKYWSEEELHQQADLVVIAQPVQTHDTNEQSVVLSDIKVVGVSTNCKVLEVLKGDRSLKRFVLHHYRLARVEDFTIKNGPSLIMFDPEQKYKMFLLRESDGRYAPVSGQTDPHRDSIWEVSRTKIIINPKRDETKPSATKP